VVAPFAAVRRAPEGSANNILELNEFRRGVGLCIYRADGLVFAARRMDDPQQSWQMPQVGCPGCAPHLPPPWQLGLSCLHSVLTSLTHLLACRAASTL
jgi:hypothetical protein